MTSNTSPPLNSPKVIWISGGSTGIGAALVNQLAEQGHHLYITARSAEKIADLQAQHPNQINALPGDIKDLTLLKQHAEQIQAQHGQLDLLILNAGTAEYVDTQQFDSQLFKRVMDTNFMGCMYLLEAALPLLRKSDTRTIVGIGSIVVKAPFSRSQAYGASKAALHYCLDSLRVDLAHEGFTVCLVAPGFVKTPLTDRNDFPMPMRISAEKAAQHIIKGIQARKHFIQFPPLFCGLLTCISLLPSSLKQKLMQSLRKKTEPQTMESKG